MTGVDEVWWVAGGEPGAKRFGTLVQGLRQQRELSVDQVAKSADLAAGTVRAIEQGRRAPSQHSAARLLRVLLPEDALPETDMRLDPDSEYTFIDPQSGARVLLTFQARTAGDNRRWSSDRPRPGETDVESLIRELSHDPEWLAKVRKSAEAVAGVLGPVVAHVTARAARPASDSDYGLVVRRLSGVNEYRLAYVAQLLDWWEEKDSGTADEVLLERLSKVQSTLNSYQKLSEEDLVSD